MGDRETTSCIEKKGPSLARGDLNARFKKRFDGAKIFPELSSAHLHKVSDIPVILSWHCYLLSVCVVHKLHRLIEMPPQGQPNE